MNTYDMYACNACTKYSLLYILRFKLQKYTKQDVKMGRGGEGTPILSQNHTQTI